MSKNDILQLEQRNGTQELYRTSERGFRVSALTDVIPAGFAAGGVLYSQVIGQQVARASYAFIERIRLAWTTITAFGTPVTAGRRLAIGTTTDFEVLPTGGAEPPIWAKNGESSGAGAASLYGGTGAPGTSGLIMVATTTALGAVTIDPNEVMAQMTLSHAGAAGAFSELVLDFGGNVSQQRQFFEDVSRNLVIYSPATMDAGGTFQLLVEVDWQELPNFLPLDESFNP